MSRKGQTDGDKQVVSNGKSASYLALIESMKGMAVFESDNNTSAESFISTILDAETEEEMWESDEIAPINAKMLVGCEFRIHGFVVKKSNRQGMETLFKDPSNGDGMFLFIESTRISDAGEKREFNLPEVGEQFYWNTSAQGIVPKLFWLAQHGKLDDSSKPVDVTIKAVPAANGDVLKLRPLPKRIVTTA